MNFRDDERLMVNAQFRPDGTETDSGSTEVFLFERFGPDDWRGRQLTSGSALNTARVRAVQNSVPNDFLRWVSAASVRYDGYTDWESLMIGSGNLQSVV
jgi:hypothetical protein